MNCCSKGPIRIEQQQQQQALGCVGKMRVDPWILEEVSVDAGFNSAWGFHETVEDLKHRLLCATLEMETLRASAMEDLRKKEENMNHLLHLLQVITHERDEARDQLHLLLARMKQTRGSSSVTESDAASPAESSFNVAAAASLEIFSGIKTGSDAVIEGLVVKKPLPQKGKFLQAVQEAGPLLQSLLLAGPLPQWRNPPPLQQFQPPPVVPKARCSPSIPHDGDTYKFEQMRSYDNSRLKRQKTQCMGARDDFGGCVLSATP